MRIFNVKFFDNDSKKVLIQKEYPGDTVRDVMTWAKIDGRKLYSAHQVKNLGIHITSYELKENYASN